MKHFYVRTSVRLTLAVIAASSVTLPYAFAEQLDNITVTANRLPSASVLAANTVITRADIEQLQITDLPSLLSHQAGIDLTMSGGLGKTSSLFIRGTNSTHILFLVDGVKWHSATLGSTNIQDFPVEQIERVEIVRGPRSGLYGSEAIGGVIQIFTRQGKQGFTPYAKVSYGSNRSQLAAAGVSGGTKITKYNLSVNHQKTDGINATDNNDSDDDGYKNNSLSAKIQHKLTDKITLGANVSKAYSTNQYDGFVATSSSQGKSEQQVVGVNSAIAISELWSLSLNLSESRDSADEYTNNSLSSVFNTQHRAASLINTLSITDNQSLSLGLDYDEDKVDSTTDYDKKSRDNKAGFISWQGTHNKHSWLLSGRHDENEEYGSHKTGTAEWGVWLQDNLQFSLNYGTGYKAPSFNDLYYPGYSDPTLKAEKSNSFAMNLRAVHGWGGWNFHLYNTHIKDLLQFDLATFSTKNIGVATISGVELELDTQLFDWDIMLNASLLDPTDTATGKVLARRAKQLANIHIDKQWNEWTVGASWKLRGYSFDEAANSIRLGGYGLVDVRASYNITHDVLIEGRISNLFDKNYQTVNHYNSVDRTAMITLSYKP
mgnify:CR=1 FL=1